MPQDKNSSGSTLPRRQLGRELRKLREEAGLTVAQAAEATGRSSPTIWRIEKGGSPMRPGDVAGMCMIYGAQPEMTEALVALAKETNNPGWWRSYTGAIPKWLDTFIGLEQVAQHVRLYDGEFVPGLLQTESYAHATCRSTRPEPSESERVEWVAVRMRRQRILTRKTPRPPRLEAIIGEAALLRPPRDKSAMVEQLLRLREVTELPNVTVRVLPLEVALECDPGGRFYVFEFPPERNGRHREPPVVYTDNLAGALYLEKPAELKSYLGVWQNMVDNSLSHADSLDLIKSTVGRYQQ